MLAAGTGLLLQMFTLGYGLTNLSYDLLQVARPHVRADEAVIIYLDEESHAKLQQPRNRAWDRSLHAQLLERLTTGRAPATVRRSSS